MNFEQSRANPGKWVTMVGTATKLDIKTGDYGPYGLGSITDTYGESQGVLFASSEKSPLVNVSCLKEPASWAVKYDANTQKYKVYFNQFQQGLPKGSAGPGPPQGPQQPRQATKAPVTDKDHMIIRQTAGKVFATLYANRSENMAFDGFVADCEAFTQYVINGLPKPKEQPFEEFASEQDRLEFP